MATTSHGWRRFGTMYLVLALVGGLVGAVGILALPIAIPSFKLLSYQPNVPDDDIIVKAIGKQWYWTYSYPDSKIEFDSLLVRDPTKLPADQPHLLGVDNELVVPVNKTVRVLATGADVTHSFSVPSFGIKIDSIPGRINETSFKAAREGIYYGQCSEPCGKDHDYMPIAVRVVSEAAYAAWLEEAKKKWARDDSAPTNVAQTEQAATTR